MNKKDIIQVFQGKSRSKAVLLFCAECMGYTKHKDLDSDLKDLLPYNSARIRVRECKSYDCPLWPYRLPKKTPIEPTWLGVENGKEKKAKKEKA